MISETSFGSSQALPHLRGDPRHWNELYKMNEALKFKTDCNDSEVYEGPDEPNQFEHFKTKCGRADAM